MEGIGTTLGSHGVAGVKAANQQVRAMGAGYSQLLQGAAEIAANAGPNAAGQNVATHNAAGPSGDPSRGQTVDIHV
ncbi:MAG TPA: hypothetical protein VIR38_06945 [Thalassobaculum sp.]